jgi:hypothetical protein
MNSLLSIASRVEAAAEAYRAVKPVSNLDEWKTRFNDERVSAIFELTLTILQLKWFQLKLAHGGRSVQEDHGPERRLASTPSHAGSTFHHLRHRR